MPVAQFPGDRNWGYDGAFPYAVQNSYGGPRALQRLIDRAHQAGLAVILDVVYNHLGPEGSYQGSFGHYFTDRYHTPWGDGVNFDGPWSDAVRNYILENAQMWVRDFRVDGLRLDAVHAIYDFGARHILAELQQTVQQIASEQGRTVHVIAESNQNDVRLIDPPQQNGYGLDGVWSDDFHHSVRTLLTGDREGYYQDFGCAEHLAKAFEHVFVYDGCYSPFRKRRHGSRVEARDRTKFVVCVHNHDQIGNRALGDRSASYLQEPAQRLACGLLLISPCVPMLFMGEEYGEQNPFPFFCSFGDEGLVEAVRRGRREEFAALDFQWTSRIPDPQDEATFESAKLTWQWAEGSFHACLRRLYRDLLAARRTWPPLQDRQYTVARIVGNRERPDEEASVLLVDRGDSPRLRAVANLSAERQPLPEADRRDGELRFSTEAAVYGGPRDLGEQVSELLPYELLIFGSW
jgi:maltooligosyltrehalose trehalohydrolase